MTSPLEALHLVPPIVLVDGHDVMMFASVADAERFLEPWAVEDGSAEGFDAQGRRLAFYVEPPSRGGVIGKLLGTPPGRVRIASAGGSSDPETLKAVLRQYLSILRPDSAAAISTKSLDELVAAAYPAQAP